LSREFNPPLAEVLPHHVPLPNRMGVGLQSHSGEIRKTAVEMKINPLGGVRSALFGFFLLPTVESRDALGIEDYRKKSCVSIQRMESIS
jgi:hypothetical protein